MENPKETAFLKIDFNLKPLDEIKKLISFPNSEIKRLAVKEKHGFFYKFTFRSFFESLGKKESLLNEIYTFNSRPIPGNLSEYILLEGDESEVKIPDFKNSYFSAKEELKKRIQEKTNELSRNLSRFLEHEIKTIEEKFNNETKSFRKSLDEISEKLMEFARKGEIQKINEQKKLIDSIKKESNFSDLEKDKVRAIQLEKQKHILNIENQFEKLTVIYYPIYVFTVDVSSGTLKKPFVFEFDPVSQDITGLICENCQNKSREIFMCSSGHSVCRKCFAICDSCSRGFCKKCVKNVCEICSKKICKDCAIRCFRCSRLVCKNHTRKDKVSGYSYCNNCLKKCERCGELKDPYSFKVSKKTNAEICEECFRREMQGKVLEGVFEK